MQLYTLFATPGQTADFVMVAQLRTIEHYLGRQVPRTFAAGEVSFTINHDAHGSDRHHMVGHWMVVEGIRIPQPSREAGLVHGQDGEPMREWDRDGRRM